jgi:hypothetical protein
VFIINERGNYCIYQMCRPARAKNMTLKPRLNLRILYGLHTVSFSNAPPVLASLIDSMLVCHQFLIHTYKLVISL